MAAPSVFDALDATILAAHDAGDGAELANAYGAAADAHAERGAIDVACFFYTQAYIFALENGMPQAERYAAVLRQNGRM